MRMPGRVLRALLALVILVLATVPVNPATANQGDDAHARAAALLQSLTPEERVGQLFLVTFKGSTLEANSNIANLITNHHVGGVILRADNNNFTGSGSTLTDAQALISSLQETEWLASQTDELNTGTGSSPASQYIPLFIAISQEGDTYPYDQIINGLTPLPNQMAIGATWDTSLAGQVGTVMGQELAALGFNLLIGPSLDVLDVLHTEGSEDLGTRTFGGDPYWVAEMGKAYIQGVHTGSNGQMAVIAKHFPGRGGSDRPPEEEVATVRKSLEQLKQIELAPFFAVTSETTLPEATADGLLVSHIRYQGLQGNIRATTRPISLDSTALEQVLALPEFSTWRQNGGVVVSDDLGSQALRDFFDPTGTQPFDARQVARSAFLAGNDLLYVNNFISTGDPDSYTTILRTLEFFTQKYNEDPAFAQRVNASVERLLALKFQLYGDFSLENVQHSPSDLSSIGQSQQVSFDVAQRGVTLISPSASDLTESLPRPPAINERITFITDVVPGKQCSTCPDQVTLPVDALKTAVFRLYGPQAGGQVVDYRMFSYSFTDLTNLLNGVEEIPPILENIQQSEWLVFSMVDVKSDRVQSHALQRFLAERPDLWQSKRLIVFAFNAPYFLDATDVSRLTAYYGLYSKTPAFVDVAARVLYQEISPAGSLPVSVPGVGYDLIAATAPDPSQVIPLALDLASATVPTAVATQSPATPEPTSVPSFTVGDTLPLKAGIIYDHNHRPVPDGTIVRFIFTVSGETVTTQQIETTTYQGIARATFSIQSPGLLEIRVTSDPALTSAILQLDITSTGEAIITQLAPTVVVTEPFGVANLTPTPTATISATPAAGQGRGAALLDWIFSMLVVWGFSAIILGIGAWRVSLRWGVRWGLLACLGGLLAYSVLGIFVPRALNWGDATGRYGLLVTLILGVVAGWAVGWVWKNRPPGTR